MEPENGRGNWSGLGKGMADASGSANMLEAEIEAMIPLVYKGLRSLADRYLRRHPSDTLHPTALVHEAWMKLESSASFKGPEHYRAVAATAMRQILVDRARSRGRLKRGENPVRTTVSGLVSDAADLDIVDLNRALEELEASDPRAARIVELRYFGGLSTPEVAAWLEVSPRTVASSWRLSRAWLVERLGVS